MNFQRVWAMPTSDTFDCEPIKGFVQKYLMHSKVSVDPFARNKRWCTYTNDINPNTAAEYHIDAVSFLAFLEGKRVKTDLFIFDPPYSVRQTKECYEEFGLKMTLEDTWNGQFWSNIRKAALPLLTPDAIVLSFGWSSAGFGRELGFDILEILLVPHGGAHHDTICVAEQRQPDNQLSLLSSCP
jgi:hypothetical protein